MPDRLPAELRPSPPPETFSRDEVAQVFALAATLQRQADARADGALTAADLERIAAESGLDPALVRRAAAAVRRERVGGGSARWLGGALWATRRLFRRSVARSAVSIDDLGAEVAAFVEARVTNAGPDAARDV